MSAEWTEGNLTVVAADECLTVMTLNLWGHQKWEQRRDAVAAWVNEVRPDLLAIQEVVRTADHCQATWLADHTGMTATFAAASDGNGFEFGNAVLSRAAVITSRSTLLTNAGRDVERRGAITVEVREHGRRVVCTATHLSHLFNEGWLRERQVLELAEFIRNDSEDFPPIVCGDFNARPDSTEVRFVKGLHALDGVSCHLFDVYETVHPGRAGHTWDNRNPNAATNRVPAQRIDYIFVGVRTADGAGQVLASDIVCDEPRDGVWPSDHFGVTARLYAPAAASIMATR